jgi:hypothetical protein
VTHQRIHTWNISRRACFAKSAATDNTTYATLADVTAAWPDDFTANLTRLRCPNRTYYDQIEGACVITADQFDSIFVPETRKPPSDDCQRYNEIALQTAGAGLAHALQPIAAFFYKVNDYNSQACNPGRALNTTQASINSTRKQVCLYNALTNASGRAPIAVVGLNLSDDAFNTTETPFFCNPDPAFYACD